MEPTVRAIERVADLLQCFSHEQPELTVADIARRLGLPASTVHRLLASLVAVELIERPSRGRYRLGLRLHEIGQTAVFGNVLRERGHVHLETLRSRTGHTSQLAVLSGTDVVYIDRLEDSRVFGRFGRSGARVSFLFKPVNVSPMSCRGKFTKKTYKKLYLNFILIARIVQYFVLFVVTLAFKITLQ